MDGTHGKCSRCGKVLLPGHNGDICSECQTPRNLGLDQETLKLWQDSLSPAMTSEDSIRSCSWHAQSDSLPSPSVRSLRRLDSKNTGPVDFEIRQKLGAGGMGVVYTAHQASINREVALKMVRPEFTSSRSAAEALMSEAVVTGCLDHPNVVPVYDLGVDDEGRLFYAMKEVEGHPWSVVITEKTWDENLDILLRVADTVSFAHSKGILHRDLKPQNIMLGAFGEIMVMDWGAACSLGGTHVVGLLPSDTAYCGTPAYMAPEMAKADKNRLGEASDIYLLGAILYQIITGHPPRREKDPLLCLLSAAENHIDLVEEDSELLRIALKAMAAAPVDRYPDIKSFQQALREYRSHSESLLLLANSKANLERAKEEGNYELFNRVVYGLREALELWKDNLNAQAMLDMAMLDYAQCAIGKYDYELAQSLLDKDGQEHAGLLQEIRVAIRDRDSRKKRVRRLLLTARILLVAIAVISGITFFMIQIEKEKASSQSKIAEEQRKRAVGESRQKLINRISYHYFNKNYDATIESFWELYNQYKIEGLDEETLLNIRVASAMNPFRGSIASGITNALKILPADEGDCIWVVGKEELKKIRVNPGAGYEQDSLVSIHHYSFGKRMPLGQVEETIQLPIPLGCGEAACFQQEKYLWIGSGSEVHRLNRTTGEWELMLDVALLKFNPLPKEYNLPEDERNEFFEWMNAEARDHPVTGLQVTRDGTHAAIALGTGLVCWVDIQNQCCKGWFSTKMSGDKPFKGRGMPILDFSPNEKILAYREGSPSATSLFVFDLKEFYREAFYYTKNYPIRTVRFALDDQLFAFTRDCVLFAPDKETIDHFGPFVSDRDNSGRWEIGNCILQRLPQKNCRIASFSKNGERFCAYMEDGILLACSSVKGGYEVRHRIRAKNYTDCMFSDNGRVLMLDEYGQIHAYDMDSYAIRHLEADLYITDVCNGSRTNTMLISTLKGGTNSVYEIDLDNRWSMQPRLHNRRPGSRLQSDPAGRYAVFHDKYIGTVFEIESGGIVLRHDNDSGIERVAFDEMGKYMACVGGWNNKGDLTLYCLKDGTTVTNITECCSTDVILIDSTEDIELVVAKTVAGIWCLVSYKILSGEEPQLVELWEKRTGIASLEIIPYADPEDHKNKIWARQWMNGFRSYDALTGMEMGRTDRWKWSGIIDSVYVSRDPRVVLIMEYEPMEIVLKSDLLPIFDDRFVDQKIDRAAFSSDGSALAMVHDGQLSIMNLSNKITEEPVPQHTPVHYVSKTGSDSWPYMTMATAARSIEDALNCSSDGDTILVDDGEYIVDKLVLAKGKRNITLRSVNGKEDCHLIRNRNWHQRTIIFMECSGTTTIQGITFRGKDGSGAGIYAFGCGDFSVSDCEISGGNGEYGGGLRFHMASNSVSRIDITNCTISNNVALGGGGIGIFGSEAHISARIENCEITGNTASKWGGGGIIIKMPQSTGSVDIVNCRIENNKSVTHGGGIECIANHAKVNISNSNISGNEAEGDGAGLWCSTKDGNILVSDSFFTGNKAGKLGGGIKAIPNEGTCLIRDSMFSSNIASGEVNHVSGGILLNCTLVRE